MENEASLRISVAKMGGYLRLHVLVRGAGTKRGQAIIESIPYSAILTLPSSLVKILTDGRGIVKWEALL